MSPVKRRLWSLVTGAGWYAAVAWSGAPEWGRALAAMLGFTLAAIYYELGEE